MMTLYLAGPVIGALWAACYWLIVLRRRPHDDLDRLHRAVLRERAQRLYAALPIGPDQAIKHALMMDDRAAMVALLREARR